MAERLELAAAVRGFAQVLLDSSVLISEFNRSTARLRDINRPQRATSIVVLWEFLHGAKGALLSRRVRGERREWLDQEGILTLRLSERCSKSFQSLLHVEGVPDIADALLAAESLARGIPVVTSNEKHFKVVTGLRYVAW
jgi:predicted nucleic acid-binding protein